MDEFEYPPPAFDIEHLLKIAKDQFDVSGVATGLVSERDQNIRITDSEGQSVVLKIANSGDDRSFLLMQNQMLRHLALTAPDINVPYPVMTTSGADLAVISAPSGEDEYYARVLTYLDGRPLGQVAKTPALNVALGRFMGRISHSLRGFGHPAAHRPRFLWNLDNAHGCSGYVADINNAENCRMVEQVFAAYNDNVAPRLHCLRSAFLHQDGNDNNIIVSTQNPEEIVGIIDFGDVVFGRQINELAVTLAYALLETDDVLSVAQDVIAGYVSAFALEDQELDIVFDLAAMRLAMSVCISSHRARQFPDNDYLLISQEPAFEALSKLQEIGRDKAKDAAYSAARNRADVLGEKQENSFDELMARRQRVLGPSLSLSYDKKLKIIKGRGCYLYDHTGRAYLDCVNNISHVGHCHPRVVEAMCQQAAVLNTNTRYLHDTIVNYAERLSATLPDPLSVCFFVCSGSEANELALRMARTVTGTRDTIVIDWGYHGNTGDLVELSPYKFNRAGGSGQVEHIHIADLPDPYRGPHKGYSEDVALRYVQSVEERIADVKTRTGRGPAAFIAESISGCGGQVVFPKRYLKHSFAAVRAAGGLCIADEVQVGFGRVGSAMWGFELQDGVPDIVTLGKPIGNGHPMACVVTTPEIADAFANGMEYFNSFGGNPVSCAVGMAVLDVIEEEGLQENAAKTGVYLFEQFNRLEQRFEKIGDVRGTGLFFGIELVKDREILEPDEASATGIINHLRNDGVLLSTDGPFNNVLKLKPPMVFSQPEAEIFCQKLERAFETFE